MMQWLRLYHDVLDDPKVQGLPSDDFKNWINVLIIASQNDPRGELPSPTDVAFFLRLSQEQAEALCARLLDRELLDPQNGRLVIHGWAERQYESDDSTKRVRTFRERKKRAPGNVSCSVSGHVSETVPDTDTEQKQNRSRTEQKSGSQPLAFSGTHLNITEKQDKLLAKAFPWVDRPGEYCRIDSWLEANPKRKPKGTSRFVHNWMSRIAAPRNGDSRGQWSKNDPDMPRRAAEDFNRRHGGRGFDPVS
jgi:hypothetical protein